MTSVSFVAHRKYERGSLTTCHGEALCRWHWGNGLRTAFRLIFCASLKILAACLSSEDGNGIDEISRAVLKQTEDFFLLARFAQLEAQLPAQNDPLLL